MFAAYARWTGLKLLSGIIFAVLSIAWLFALSFLFKITGLRASFQGASDGAIVAMSVAFLVLIIPVFIGHGRIMARIRE